MNEGLSKFVESQDIVFSVCSDFNWTADYEILRRAGLTIKQKVPLKMYLGISHSDNVKQATTILSKDSQTQKIKTQELKEIIGETDKLKIFINLDPKTNITFFTEFPRGVGLSFVSCISVLLSEYLSYLGKSTNITKTALEIETLLRGHEVSESNIISKFYPSLTTVFDDRDNTIEPLKNRYELNALFDFIIIYSGKPSNTEMSIDRLERLESNDELKIYQNLSILMGEKLYQSLRALSLEGYSERVMQNTTNILKKFRYMWHIMDKTSPSMEKIKNEAIHVLNTKFPNLNYGLKFLNGNTIGGSLLLVIPKDGLKGSIDEFLKEVNELSGERAYIIYNSDKDGTKCDKSQIIKCEKGGNRDLTNITFNTTENKIYINGAKFSSKELPSQVQIIKLFQAIDGASKITNDKLEKSSYSSNRYDLESKIIIPFKKLIKLKTGKKFPIKCRGNQHRFSIEVGEISDNFEIIFEEI